jgi:hypothetical protein
MMKNEDTITIRIKNVVLEVIGYRVEESFAVDRILNNQPNALNRLAISSQELESEFRTGESALQHLDPNRAQAYQQKNDS